MAFAIEMEGGLSQDDQDINGIIENIRKTEQIAMVQEGAPVSEFSVREAQSRSSEQHLAQAHQAAHAQTQDTARTAAPSHAAPERAMA